MLLEERERLEDMCELLDRVEEKGRQEGIKEGLEEGLEKGTYMTQLKNIRSIMEGLKYTSEQAMDLLKIPAEDRQEYASKL